MSVLPATVSEPSTSERPPHKIGPGLFSLFLALGLILTLVFGIALIGTVRSYLWKETPCTIVESLPVKPGVNMPGSSDGFVISYRYVANGEERTSNVFSRGISMSRDKFETESLLARYPVNSAARCYVNPANPAQAVLHRESPWLFAVILVPLLFVAIGVSGLKGAGPFVDPKTVRPSSKPGGIIFALVFILAFLGVVYVLAIHPTLRVLAARSWVETPCRILISDVREEYDKEEGETTYHVDIGYSYRVDGTEYRSKQYQFMDHGSKSRGGKAAIAKRYPVGTTTTCFVNPADPTDAVINRGFHLWIVFWPLLLAYMVIAGRIRNIIRGKRSRAPRAGARTSSG